MAASTGFTELFDFRLTWTPDMSAAPDASTDGLCPTSFEQGQQRLRREKRHDHHSDQ
jgi:hypothetical protein